MASLERRVESLLLRLFAMRLQRRVSNGALSPFGSVHLPLRRLALCLDCDECFELGYESCPACGSGTWSAVARFLDLVADPGTRRPMNKLIPRRGMAAAPAEKYLFIVSRHQRELYEDLKKAFSKREGVEVLLDRRIADRRRRQADAPVLERRRSDQRRRAVDGQLQTFGWALIAIEPVRSRKI